MKANNQQTSPGKESINSSTSPIISDNTFEDYSRYIKNPNVSDKFCCSALTISQQKIVDERTKMIRSLIEEQENHSKNLQKQAIACNDDKAVSNQDSITRDSSLSLNTIPEALNAKWRTSLKMKKLTDEGSKPSDKNDTISNSKCSK